MSGLILLLFCRSSFCWASDLRPESSGAGDRNALGALIALQTEFTTEPYAPLTYSLDGSFPEKISFGKSWHKYSPPHTKPLSGYDELWIDFASECEAAGASVALCGRSRGTGGISCFNVRSPARGEYGESARIDAFNERLVPKNLMYSLKRAFAMGADNFWHYASLSDGTIVVQRRINVDLKEADAVRIYAAPGRRIKGVNLRLGARYNPFLSTVVELPVDNSAVPAGGEVTIDLENILSGRARNGAAVLKELSVFVDKVKEKNKVGDFGPIESVTFLKNRGIEAHLPVPATVLIAGALPGSFIHSSAMTRLLVPISPIRGDGDLDLDAVFVGMRWGIKPRPVKVQFVKRRLRQIPTLLLSRGTKAAGEVSAAGLLENWPVVTTDKGSVGFLKGDKTLKSLLDGPVWVYAPLNFNFSGEMHVSPQDNKWFRVQELTCSGPACGRIVVGVHPVKSGGGGVYSRRILLLLICLLLVPLNDFLFPRKDVPNRSNMRVAYWAVSAILLYFGQIYFGMFNQMAWFSPWALAAVFAFRAFWGGVQKYPYIVALGITGAAFEGGDAYFACAGLGTISVAIAALFHAEAFGNGIAIVVYYCLLVGLLKWMISGSVEIPGK